MKLSRGAFIFPCNYRALEVVHEPTIASAGSVTLRLLGRGHASGDDWQQLEGGYLSPSAARKLVRKIIGAAERAAAWKRAAKIVRGRR